MRSTTPTSPAALGDRVEVAASGGPGSTTTDRREPGSRSTHVLVPSRVIGFAFGASTHSRRAPEGATRPAHRLVTRLEQGRRSRSGHGAASPTSSSPPRRSGMNISTIALGAAASTAVGVGVLRRSPGRSGRSAAASASRRARPRSTRRIAGSQVTADGLGRDVAGALARGQRRRRRTRCGSACGSKTGVSQPDQTPSRSVRSTSPRRSRNSVNAARAPPARAGRPPSRHRWCRRRPRPADVPASSTPDSSKVSRTAAQPAPAPCPRRRRAARPTRPATARPSATEWSKSRGSTPPPGKTHIPPAKAIEPAGAAGRPPGPSAPRAAARRSRRSRGSAGSRRRRRRRGACSTSCGGRLDAAAHQTSTISSTSTGASSGSTATPTADRACTPASPNTSPSSSETPLATCGWPVKSGVEATKPTTLTTRLTARQVADLGLDRGERVQRALPGALDGLLRA